MRRVSATCGATQHFDAIFTVFWRTTISTGKQEQIQGEVPALRGLAKAKLKKVLSSGARKEDSQTAHPRAEAQTR